MDLTRILKWKRPWAIGQAFTVSEFEFDLLGLANLETTQFDEGGARRSRRFNARTGRGPDIASVTPVLRRS